MSCVNKPSLPCAGFTLLELIVVMACVALLATAAWPSYQSAVMRGNRAQARTALLQAAHWFERAASANGTYPAAADVPTSVLQVDGQRYRVSAASTAQTFTLTATPIGAQASDPCGALTLDYLGTRGAVSSSITPSQAVAQCWSK